MKPVLPILLCLMGVLGPSPVRAHSTSTSFLVLELSSDEAAAGSRVAVRWDLSVQDIVWMVFIDADYDGEVTTKELDDAKPALTPAVLGQLSLRRGGIGCPLSVSDHVLAERTGQDFISVSLQARCPESGRVEVGGSLFMSGDAAQRVLLSATRGAETFTGVLSGSTPAWEEPVRFSALGSFLRFIGEGVWHVLIGYDHIAFVLLLLLPSVMRPVDGKWQGAKELGQVTRDLVTIITAFTIAHSTTLALAVTGALRLPAQPIEVAIALSIAAAAALNLLPRLSGWRLPLAFGFGFVHGFGFANALSEIDTAGSTLLPLLAGFNIGVELAQLGIVALVLPLIYSMRSARWYAGGVLPLGSCALGAAGLVWLIQRI